MEWRNEVRHKMKKTAKYLIICLLISSFFTCFPACGSSEAAGGEAAETGAQADETAEKYEVPEFRGAQFHEDEAYGNDEVLVDTSRSSKGFYRTINIWRTRRDRGNFERNN